MCSRPYYGRLILTSVHVDHTGVDHTGNEWGRNLLNGTTKSTGQPSQVKASAGTRLMVLKGRAQIARQRRRHARRRLEEERDSAELAREPSFIPRVWEEIRDFIFLPGRRY
jgi:hypothetical protein